MFDSGGSFEYHVQLNFVKWIGILFAGVVAPLSRRVLYPEAVLRPRVSREQKKTGSAVLKKSASRKHVIQILPVQIIPSDP
jgi:hypothetical protein